MCPARLFRRNRAERRASVLAARSPCVIDVPSVSDAHLPSLRPRRTHTARLFCGDGGRPEDQSDGERGPGSGGPEEGPGGPAGRDGLWWAGDPIGDMGAAQAGGAGAKRRQQVPGLAVVGGGALAKHDGRSKEAAGLLYTASAPLLCASVTLPPPHMRHPPK